MIYLILLATGCQSLIFLPQQVHIAWNYEDTSMTVTWASEYPSTGSSVQYTPVSSKDEKVTAYQYTALGIWNTFPNINDQYLLVRQLHSCSALMKGLNLGGLYKYRVGSDFYGWSKEFYFKAKRNFTETIESHFLVYGDFGVGDQIVETMERLIEETENYEYDAIFHVGDFAYDLDSYQGQVGDEFLRSIEPVASKVPYMVAQGNHEDGNRVQHYYYRFKMPSPSNNLWYSFNAGKAHFLAYSTEFIFQNYVDLQNQQNEFIIKDLENYDKEKYPWLIVFGQGVRVLGC